MKTGSEEKYPLLYLIVDKENGNSNMANNRKFFEKRYGITAGVSNVFERWPGYLGACWLSSLIFILALVSMFVLLMTAFSTYKLHRIPICVPGDNPMLDNSTIHLVHGPTSWNQFQLNMIEKIIQVFPNHRIHLILIKKPTNFDSDVLNNNNNDVETSRIEETTTTLSSTDGNTAASRKLLRLPDDPTAIFRDDNLAGDSLLGWPFFDPRDFISTFLKKTRSFRNKHLITTTKPTRITNIASLLLQYPSIFSEVLTYEEAFEKSPLFLKWHHLNEDTKLFAIRVLQLWQYGGLSFDLIQAKNFSEENKSKEETLLRITTESNNGVVENVSSSSTLNEPTSTVSSSTNYIDSLLYLGYSNFQMIPGGIVTLAENGCHMETKSACHSFFGEILLNLKDANLFTTPEDVIRGALKYFLKPTSHRNVIGRYN